MWPKQRLLQPHELRQIYEADDPLVLNGTYTIHGFTPNEWIAYQKKLAKQ